MEKTGAIRRVLNDGFAENQSLKLKKTASQLNYPLDSSENAGKLDTYGMSGREILQMVMPQNQFSFAYEEKYTEVNRKTDNGIRKGNGVFPTQIGNENQTEDTSDSDSEATIVRCVKKPNSSDYDMTLNQTWTPERIVTPAVKPKSVPPPNRPVTPPERVILVAKRKKKAILPSVSTASSSKKLRPALKARACTEYPDGDSTTGVSQSDSRSNPTNVAKYPSVTSLLASIPQPPDDVVRRLFIPEAEKANDRKFSVRGKRVSPTGKVEYLIEWHDRN